MRLNAKQIALYTGGSFVSEPLCASDILSGITWDSREVKPGWLFVALPGEHVDGHDFIEPAIRAGAKAILISEPIDELTLRLANEMGVALISVSNTYHAITDLAANWRSQLKATVIGITGSVGKTTTKNLMRDVVAAGKSVVATKANQNNELGVPNTILAADPETEVLIVEMGMRGKGQIAELAKMVKPDWGVITNVGESHIELLGSREAIADAKRELFDALPSGTGKAFVNAQDEFASDMVAASKLAERGVEVIAFGGEGADASASASEAADAGAGDEAGAGAGGAGDTGTGGAGEGEGAGDEADASTREGADAGASASEATLPAKAHTWAEDACLDEAGRAQFTLCAKGFLKLDEDKTQPTLFNMQPDIERAGCHLTLSGMHNITNACAAAAVGRALGISADDIALALETSVPEAGRQVIHTSREGFKVIDDSYNASPDSMRAALSAFCAMSVQGKRYAVLGDMGELGDIAEKCHFDIGQSLATYPVDMLICVGDLSREIARGALEAGMPDERIELPTCTGDVLARLEGKLTSDDAVLVKASHFMELNRVVEGLLS